MVSTSTSFVNDIKQIISGSPPSLSSQQLTCGSIKLSGGFYTSADGKTATIYYFLRGDQPCESMGGAQLVGKIQQDDATRCQLRLPVRT